MKIVFDARILGKNMHGIARYCLNLLQQLLAGEKRHEYLILISHPQVQGWFAPSTQVRWMPVAVPLYGLREQWLLPYRLRRERFDLFHSPSYAFPLVFSAKGILTIHDLIHLLFPRDYGFRHRFYYSLLVRRSVSRCLKIITVSEQSKKDIVSLLKGDGLRVAVIPNGLDCQWGPQPPEEGFLERYGLDKGFLLFVGNQKPHKNFLRLQKAFEGLIKEGVYRGKLVAVGIDHQNLSADPGDKMVFFPFCDDRALRSLYSGADLLAAPSLYEGFGLPVLEAMACGCPVLAGNRGALPEVVGRAGLLVDPYDAEVIKEGMKKILFDESFRAGLRDRGFKQAAGYSWETAGQKVMEIYDSLEKDLGGHPA
jgi:glycosyltransferase involved in cell wall biosynthesis